MKLSAAIKKGIRVAKKSGLRLGTGTIYDGINVCAIGCALLGSVGLRKIKMQPSEICLSFLAEKTFPELGNSNQCLSNQLAADRGSDRSLEYGVRIMSEIITYNDELEYSPQLIADKLEECGL